MPGRHRGLTYSGKLWAERAGAVLDDEIARGKAALTWRRRRRAHALNRPPRRRSSVSAEAEALAQPVGVEHVVDRSGGEDLAVAAAAGRASCRRDVVDVVGDEHERRRGRIGGQVVERRDELLAAAEVEAGRGLVEQHHGRVVHQRAGQQHASGARRTTASRAPLGEPSDAHPLEAGQGPASSSAL